MQYMSSINIAFWNVGVSPLFHSKPDFIRAAEVFSMVENIMKNRYLDFFILCEMNTIAIDSISKLLPKHKIIRANDNVSRNLHFDMVLILSNRVKLISSTPIFDRTKDEGGHAIKVGYQFLIEMSNGFTDSSSKRLCVIASHWPSKIRDSDSFKKDHAARVLSGICAIERLKKDRQIILIGDYNDEYESTSIKKILYSTINRNYAKDDSRILYNLSGMMSGPHVPNAHGVDYHYSGTWVSSDVKSRVNDENSCRVFDQIMLSSSMIEIGPWIVNERRSGIINNKHLKKMVTDCLIDHLPICLNAEIAR